MLVKDSDFYSITLALAGMIQAVALVQTLAHTGKLDEIAFEASIHSIFQMEAKDIASIYQQKAHLRFGLTQLSQLLSARDSKTNTLTRHTLSLIHLQKKIWREPALLLQLNSRLNKVKKQVDFFHLTHPTVIASLADTYLTTISPFRFRIMIRGTQRALGVADNMNKIRALLFAGIRATLLWHQVGGSRWQLLFKRSKIKAMAEKILTEFV